MAAGTEGDGAGPAPVVPAAGSASPRRIQDVVLILCVAVLARLLVLALFDPASAVLSGDTPLFLRQAADPFGGVDHEPPGYPAFLALIFRLGGSNVTVMLAQAALTIGTAILTYRRIPGRALALATALVMAACPFYIVFEFRLLTEVIASHFVWIAFLLLAFPHRPLEPLVGGLLLGSAIMTRDTLLLLPVFTVVAAFWGGADLRRRAVLVLLAASFVVVPWQVANRSVSLSSGRFGYILWIGTWERSPAWMSAGIDSTSFPDHAFSSPVERAALLSAYEKHDDAAFKAAALRRLARDPAGVATTWLVRYPRLWLGTRVDHLPLRLESHRAPWLLVKGGAWILGAGLVLLGLVGACQSVVTKRSWFILAAPIAYLGSVLLPFHNTEPRYTLPAMGSLIFFSCLVVHDLVRRRRSRRVPDAGSAQPVTDIQGSDAAGALSS